MTGAYRVLLFATALVLMLAQTFVLGSNIFVEQGRWAGLALLCAPVLFRSPNAPPIRSLAPLDLLAICFIGFAVLSAFYSPVPGVSLQRASSVAMLYVAVFWGIWNHADRAGEERVLDAILAAAAVIFVAGALYAIFFDAAWLSNGRFRGVLVNPNSVGLLAALTLPIVITRVLERVRLADVSLLVLIAASLLLSGSRGGAVGAAVGIAYVLHRRRGWKIGFVLATLLLSTHAVWNSVGLDAVAQVTGLHRLVAPDALSQEGGGRLEAWSVALPRIRQDLVFGHGFGAEETVFRGLERRFRQHQGEMIHNSYLGMAFQLGIPGVVLFFAPLWALLLLPPRSRSVPETACRGVLAAGLVIAFFESWPYSVGNAFTLPFWICVMITVRARLAAPAGLHGPSSRYGAAAHLATYHSG